MTTGIISRWRPRKAVAAAAWARKPGWQPQSLHQSALQEKPQQTWAARKPNMEEGAAGGRRPGTGSQEPRVPVLASPCLGQIKAQLWALFPHLDRRILQALSPPRPVARP